ncbi:hypothetical protein ASG31_14665 [Chryseobacterium sp. Leaf404]|uniref:FkbM family methyltransferase n=1 Tax=unclassified Chryseobacterium TaxID=2593645 RepID=UPI0006F2039C|nr:MULTISPECIES: FkbM family methyltransferase [unclassified Chryseobacterium]KQT15502.1 hypothetical protein ASG31_14665 [Chryseobacterium sp. Leaf404]
MSIFRKKTKNTSDNIYIKKSFSQCGEDILVDFIFKNILGKNDFTYMDVGAHHPYYLSNTALFYEQGFKGISIEPDPSLFTEIKKQRPNEICLNVGVLFDNDITESDVADFYIMSTPTLNTFSKEEAERLHTQGTYTIVDKKKIQIKHLHKIFDEYFLPDFLSIDVEGLDKEIITSINFEKYRPKVICIETLEFSPDGSENNKNINIINFLSGRNYSLYADTNINSIFVDKKLLKYQ